MESAEGGMDVVVAYFIDIGWILLRQISLILEDMSSTGSRQVKAL
jgi:hypothetical protein